MKNPSSKTLIPILLSLMITRPIMASCEVPSMPNYLRCFQQPHGKNYAFNCLLIDMAHIIRGLGLLIYYRTTHKKKNLDQAINLIQDQLKEFETWLLQEEQDALLGIKNKFNMNNETWNACIADIQELKNIYKKEMLQGHPNIYHDKKVPTDLLHTITTMLLNSNINPHSISIKMIENKNQSTQMQVRSYVEKTIDETDNKLIISKQYLPITFEIFPVIKQNIAQEKMIALCAHEIQHIIQQHALTQNIITSYLQYYCSIDNAALIKSPEFQRFIQIHEAQAELLSAIKNPEIAHCLSWYRSYAYYPHYLYEDHYYNISTVDMLWKLDTWLTWCQQFSITKTKDTIITKMHNLADSFKELIAIPQQRI